MPATFPPAMAMSVASIAPEKTFTSRALRRTSSAFWSPRAIANSSRLSISDPLTGNASASCRLDLAHFRVGAGQAAAQAQEDAPAEPAKSRRQQVPRKRQEKWRRDEERTG